MGCINSRPGDGDVVRRFRARKRFMKQAVLQRQAFATAHCAYLHALRNTGSALRQFAEGEAKDGASTPGRSTLSSHTATTSLQLGPPPPPLPPPPPAAPLPSSANPGRHNTTKAAPVPEERAASPNQHRKGNNWSPGSSSDKASDTPPPPPPQESTWDIFNPFRPSSPPFHLHESRHQRRSRDGSQKDYTKGYYGYEDVGALPDLEDDFERHNTALAKWESSNRSSATMVMTGSEMDLLDIVKEVDDRFLKASGCGTAVSKVLETRKGHFLNDLPDIKRTSNAHPFSALTWSWPKSPLSAADEASSVFSVEAHLMGSHALTLERLCAWERKLFSEVKAGEALRSEHQKKCTLLRSQEVKGEDLSVVDETRVAIKRLHSLILVSFQGVDSTTAAVKKMRDEELYPQLVELAEGLMYMWRTLHDCHEHQKQVVLQLKNLDSWATHEATTDHQHHATVELEKELSNWHECFCKLVGGHRDYMTALNGWSRLSLMEIDMDEGNKENDQLMANEESTPPRKPPAPRTVTLCEEWQKALDRLPDKVASEAIKSLAAVVHALVMQQTEELKQKKKVEQLIKRLEKMIANLHTAERKQVEAAARTPPAVVVAQHAMSKKSDTEEVEEESMSSTNFERVNEDYGSAAATTLAGAGDPLTERKAAVEALKKKVEGERLKHAKCVQDTRVLTMNNLQTGLPGVFEAMTGFSAVCGQAFETLYNQTNKSGQVLQSIDYYPF